MVVMHDRAKLLTLWQESEKEKEEEASVFLYCPRALSQ
jgi:hypothetical protein